MSKEKKEKTCRVTPKEKRLLELLRVFEISPDEVARAVNIIWQYDDAKDKTKD